MSPKQNAAAHIRTILVVPRNTRVANVWHLDAKQ